MERPTAALFLIATALLIVPRTGSAQVSVTAPAAGAASSYRTTVVSWDPLPGESSYHLEIDDDPNFGSPEVDATVSGTSYTLSGERLKLHGQLSWAAYVRINGTRWNARTFTPSYFKIGQFRQVPALGVDSQNRVYLAYEEHQSVGLRTSSDWSSMTRLSLEDTFNAWGLNLAVDENDVAHVSWMEQRPTEMWVPFYTNSSTGWSLVRIPGTTGGGCSEGSIVAGGGQVDLFYDSCGEKIERWTTTNGVEFTRTAIPNNDTPTSVSAARDGVGNLYVASERYTVPFEDRHSSFQTSADGWTPHGFGPGRFPALAVTPAGELHAVRWSSEQDNVLGQKFLYSNSLRGFQTWTELTTTSTASFDQDILPLVVDESRDQLHTAMPGDGIQLCYAAHTGLAIDTGTSWTCAPVGNGDATRPDLALAPDGTLHLAWSGRHGLGYANSLGSFLATNLTPQVSFGAPSSTASTVIVPSAISDADGDGLAGHIHVGRYEAVMSRVEPQTIEPIINGRFNISNVSNAYLADAGFRLQFRAIGGTGSWDSYLNRSDLPALPATIEVRGSSPDEILGHFIIGAWDDTGVTIVQGDFVPYVKLTYVGTLPHSVDISSLPEGNAMVGIGAWDGSTSGFAAQAFTKAAGQNQLVLGEGAR